MVTVIGSLAAWIVLGLFTSPILYIGLNTHPISAGYVALGIFGWGVWFSQQLFTERVQEAYEEVREEVDESPGFLAPLLTIINLGYYNIVMYVALFIAVTIAGAGFPGVAAIFALLYPAYDMWVVYQGYPLSIAGLLAISIALAIVLANLGQVSWRDVDFGDIVYRVVGPGTQSLS